MSTQVLINEATVYRMTVQDHGLFHFAVLLARYCIKSFIFWRQRYVGHIEEYQNQQFRIHVSCMDPHPTPLSSCDPDMRNSNQAAHSHSRSGGLATTSDWTVGRIRPVPKEFSEPIVCVCDTGHVCSCANLFRRACKQNNIASTHTINNTT